jgi:hypothetical protein
VMCLGSGAEGAQEGVCAIGRRGEEVRVRGDLEDGEVRGQVG